MIFIFIVLLNILLAADEPVFRVEQLADLED